MRKPLKSMSRKELQKLRVDIDRALEDLAENEKRAALAAAEKAAKAHGYSLSDLADIKPAAQKAKKAADGKRGKVAPKYRDPANEAQTWTGRGRKPKWVEAHLAAGGSLDDIAI